jgi:ribulose 1,5-bisphosphate carboxylase large subunit-like protein
VTRVLRRTIDAVMQGIKVSDYAEKHDELRTALTKWGTGKTGF